jgi:hypothetical protein
MVTMVFVTFISPSVPTVAPVFPISAFGRLDVIVFCARHIHWLFLNPRLYRFLFDRYLNTVNDGAAPLHLLGVVARLR